jgi:hypothetical protein
VAERDISGRFVSGHAKVGGRAKGSGTIDYIAILREECSSAQWRAIIARALEQARRGDNAARRWVSEYLIGKPVETINADIMSDGLGLLDLLAGVRDALAGDGDAGEGASEA